MLGKGIMKLKREVERLTYLCNTMKSAMGMLNKEKKADKQSINDFENQSNRLDNIEIVKEVLPDMVKEKDTIRETFVEKVWFSENTEGVEKKFKTIPGQQQCQGCS